MNTSNSGTPAGDALVEAKPKTRRRPRTAVVVRPPRTKVINRDEFELIVTTLAMIAPDIDAGVLPETEK